LVNIFHQVSGWAISLIFIIFLFPISGCSLWQTGKLSLPPENLKEVFIQGVPFFTQETYQCGPASLAMVLNWTGLELTPNDLTADVYTPDLKGSLQSSLISAARQYGRLAYPIQGLNELFAELNTGHPVIVLQNLGLNWYPRWHYAVVIGYADNGRTIILHTGTKKAEHISVRVFEHTWSHSDYWGLLVLPADELPATAIDEKYLNSVAGLERARQFEASVSGYTSAINRWPKNLAAWMGLGNSFYAQGDLSSAAAAFKQAYKLHPSNGMPLNNLSQVLWEQGQKEQALQAIRDAIELGGPFKPAFEETLEGFQQQRE
jgi:tetratricopeptide (TPR) repeat protein